MKSRSHYPWNLTHWPWKLAYFLDLGPLKPPKLHMKFGILNFVCQTKNSGRWLRPDCCSRLAWAISRNFLFGMQNSESRTSKCSPHPPKAPNPKKKAIFVIRIKFWISRCQNLRIDIFQKGWSKMARWRPLGEISFIWTTRFERLNLIDLWAVADIHEHGKFCFLVNFMTRVSNEPDFWKAQAVLVGMGRLY